MKTETSIDELWDSALLGQAVFRPDQAASLPGAARRYLEHAIAPGHHSPPQFGYRCTEKSNCDAGFRSQQIKSFAPTVK